VKRQRHSIHVSVAKQELSVKAGRKLVKRFPVSTSRFGIGSKPGSKKTPLGRFRVSDKIGDGMPAGTIFKSRVPLRANEPPPASEDLIMSRILWLDGLAPENANTRDRFIYIHGTQHEDKIGEPASHGCIRMRNSDVIELFNLVEEDTVVTIKD